MTTRHLPPERRSEIARKAIAARHNPGPTRYCALSGLPLSSKKRALNFIPDQTATAPIARVVHRMKGRLPAEQFIKMCRLVAAYADRAKSVDNSAVASVVVVGGLPSQEGVQVQVPQLQ